MFRRTQLLIAAFLIVGLFMPAHADNALLGKWEGSISFGNWTSPFVLEFGLEDGELIGHWQGERMEFPLEAIERSGADLRFTGAPAFQGQSVTLRFQGAIDGDTLEGTLQSPRGTAQLEATRTEPVFLAPAAAEALPEIARVAGKWAMMLSIEGRETPSSLVVEEGPDGWLQAVWTTPVGQAELIDGALEENRVDASFALAPPGRERINFSLRGALAEDAFDGAVVGPWGTVNVRGVREEKPVAAAPEVLGAWELTSISGLGRLTHDLNINPDGSGAYTLQGREWTFEQARVTQDGLKFTVPVQLQGMPLDLAFTCQVEGDELTGRIASQAGSAQLTGQRAAVATVPAAGTWNLTSVSELGRLSHELVVNPGPSGTFSFGGRAIPVQDLAIEDSKVSFIVPLDIRGEMLEVRFQGTLDGDALTGQLTSHLGMARVSGERASAE